MKKYLVKWKDVNDYLNVLVKDIKSKKFKPTGIYGIPRGGLVLATMLSYKLDIPLLLNATSNCIIIDDIADSGRTLVHYTKNDTQFNKYYITTMFYKERSVVKPDFYFKKKKELWVEFPWEK